MGRLPRCTGPGPGLAATPPRSLFPTGETTRPAPEGGGSRYGLAALRAELAHVRTAPGGDRHNRLNRAAFSLGMLAAGGGLDRALVEEELLGAAADVGLGETEAISSVRSGLTAGAREPRRRPPDTWQRAET